jgi:hypothetical protein
MTNGGSVTELKLAIDLRLGDKTEMYSPTANYGGFECREGMERISGNPCVPPWKIVHTAKARLCI